MIAAARAPQAAPLTGVEPRPADRRDLVAAFRTRESASASAAAAALEGTAEEAVRPRFDSYTTLIATSGSSETGQPVGLQLPSLPLRRGDVVMLSVVTEQADDVTWRMIGERPGETADGHDVLVARHIVDGARLLAVAVSLPETTVVDGFTVAADPGTPLFYRYTVLRPDDGGRSFAS